VPYAADHPTKHFFETLETSEQLIRDCHDTQDGRIRVWLGLEHITYCSEQMFRRVGELAEQGDVSAIKAWEGFGSVVGTAIGTLCCVLHPHVVVIGGSVSHRLGLFEPALMSAASAILPGTSRDIFRVAPSELGDAAGVTGAAEHSRVAEHGGLPPGTP